MIFLVSNIDRKLIENQSLREREQEKGMSNHYLHSAMCIMQIFSLTLQECFPRLIVTVMIFFAKLLKFGSNIF